MDIRNELDENDKFVLQKLYEKNFGKGLGTNELERAVKINPRTLQTILKKLEDFELIERVAKGDKPQKGITIKVKIESKYFQQLKWSFDNLMDQIMERFKISNKKQKIALVGCVSDWIAHRQRELTELLLINENGKLIYMIGMRYYEEKIEELRKYFLKTFNEKDKKRIRQELSYFNYEMDMEYSSNVIQIFNTGKKLRYPDQVIFDRLVYPDLSSYDKEDKELQNTKLTSEEIKTWNKYVEANWQVVDLLRKNFKESNFPDTSDQLSREYGMITQARRDIYFGLDDTLTHKVLQKFYEDVEKSKENGEYSEDLRWDLFNDCEDYELKLIDEERESNRKLKGRIGSTKYHFN